MTAVADSEDQQQVELAPLVTNRGGRQQKEDGDSCSASELRKSHSLESLWNKQLDDVDDKMKMPKGSSQKVLAFICIVVLLFLFAFASTKSKGNSATIGTKTTLKSPLPSLQNDSNSIYMHEPIGQGGIEYVQLVLKFAKVDDTSASLQSLHRAELIVLENCPFPRIWVRLAGPALINVPLVQQGTLQSKIWASPKPFGLPLPGDYNVEVLWQGCKENSALENEPIIRLGSVHASGEVVPVVEEPISNSTSLSLFANSNWLSFQSVSINKLPPYTWFDAQKYAQLSQSTWRYTSDTAIAQEGTVKSDPEGFRKFNELGNYELLCFMGNNTMSKIRDEFLDLRPNLFNSQRPFKFHLYPIAAFTHPDRYWDEGRKSALRKCKHIMLSLDEISAGNIANVTDNGGSSTISSLGLPLSQSEYQNQITTFIDHLTKVIPDETFPIWVFTFNIHPSKSRECHTPILPRTTDHPCNDMLRHVFANNRLSARIHLLDNTDLMLPLLSQSNQQQELWHNMLAVIALRVYVIVGLGVEEWRAAGQHGSMNGLVRNGETEPNFKLIPYDGWRS